MKRSVWGILAHVDAGKTTLSEAILYNTGKVKTIGRVDHKDAFLDTQEMEKNRGITIFSKPAIFEYKDLKVTLLDTPGHVDFATEAERAIWALDYAILLISGADGVTGHTKTLFRLLREQKIPTVFFINKVDQPGVDVAKVFNSLQLEISDTCISFDDDESISLSNEGAIEEFLENGKLSIETKAELFKNQNYFPVFSGSALKNTGVDTLLEELYELTNNDSDRSQEEFGAKVYKVESLGRDARLTFLKITSGSLKVKDTIGDGEKADQLRMYSGARFEQVKAANAGDVVAVTGPKFTFCGQGLGIEKDNQNLFLSPVLEYAVDFLDDTVPKIAYEKLLALNEEEPSLHLSWNSNTSQITLHLMGEIQAEILKERIKNELSLDIQFLEGKILYKETLKEAVEGVGHFEPLRHYAEVHLLMEPLAAGSGIEVATDISTDELALNWQRLITTHILEKEHSGVLMGAPLTDVKITVTGGRAHIKHTEGGDFREATYRAVRQGLMETGTKLLEPYFSFELSLPAIYVGRALNDLEKMCGTFESPLSLGEMSRIEGIAPASTIRNYQAELVAYTKGKGSLNLEFLGYRDCHNEEEVLAESDYNPEEDIENPAASVFCSHGSGDYVPWYQVKEKCHVPVKFGINIPKEEEEALNPNKRELHDISEWLDPDEIDSILFSATHKNVGKNTKKNWNFAGSGRVRHADSDYIYRAPKEIKPKEKYLLVDGYNLIYAWPEMREVLEVNLDGARGKLLDILSNYKAMTDYEVIAVFDAYKVKGHSVSVEDYQNIHQVFTAEAQTADAYIEKFTHEHGKKYDITVVTSDGLEQVIIRGAGARLISSREFIDEIARKASELREKYGIN